MTIVSNAGESSPLLEVAVVHARDAAAATEGEADRLLLTASPDEGGRTPDLPTVSAVLRETDLPVRVVLRIDAGVTAEDSQVQRLAEVARHLVQLGAEGVSFGFLDRVNDIDARACRALLAEVPALRWTFSRLFDASFEHRRAWREVVGLPGLDAVATAGSGRGLAAGVDDLITYAGSSPAIARLVLASGGLTGDVVPWLLRAGVRQFGVAEEVRRDGSWTKSSVEAGAVRAWRLLLDDAHQRVLGVEPVD